jgi:hypothetical protein
MDIAPKVSSARPVRAHANRHLHGDERDEPDMSIGRAWIQ